MTGIAAFAVEDSYDTLPADPVWRKPGLDVQVGSLDLENALERVRESGNPTPIGSREGNLEGALSLTWTLTDDNWHDLVFADGGTALPHEHMFAPSATWYFGADMPDGTTIPRFASGATTVDASVNYSQGGPVTVEQTIIYGDEPDDIAEPTTIETPSEDQVYTWHGVSLDLDTQLQSLVQSATLSLSNLARFRRGGDRQPFDAVAGATEPSLSADVTLTEEDQRNLAYGGSTETRPADEIDAVSGQLALENGLGDTITYDLSKLQPTTYGWADLVAQDTDVSESTDFHVADVEVV